MKLHLAAIVSLIIFTTMVGCSSSYKRPESISSKMARFQSKETNSNTVPTFSLAKIALKQFQNTRVPASVINKNTSFAANKFPQSRKQIYFLSLYSQYGQLKKYSNSQGAPEINICPNFHNSLLTYKSTYGKNTGQVTINFNKRYPEKIIDKAIFPELSLPVTKEASNPTVADILNNKRYLITYGSVENVMQSALDIHLSKTYAELSQLCQYGYSDNYYSYENLLTHIDRTRSSFTPTTRNLRTLYKTTIFSNSALIQSFESASRSIASSTNKAPKNLYEKMSVTWAGQYLYEVSKQRVKQLTKQ